MKALSFSSFANRLATITGALALIATPLVHAQKVDVWYDGEGKPRRITVTQESGKTHLIEIDTSDPEAWKKRLKELDVDTSVIGEETLPDTEQLGKTHQLMQYRGFDRTSLPEGTYFSRGLGYRYGFSYPYYRHPRGGGHYCRPHHPRGGGLIFKF